MGLFVKIKSNVFSYFKEFYMMVVNQFSTHIKILWTDNDSGMSMGDKCNSYTYLRIMLFKIWFFSPQFIIFNLFFSHNSSYMWFGKI